VPCWKLANANKFFVATDVAKEGNEVHNITAIRLTLYGPIVCSYRVMS